MQSADVLCDMQPDTDDTSDWVIPPRERSDSAEADGRAPMRATTDSALQVSIEAVATSERDDESNLIEKPADLGGDGLARQDAMSPAAALLNATAMESGELETDAAASAGADLVQNLAPGVGEQEPVVGPRGGGNPITAMTGREFSVFMAPYHDFFVAEWVPTPAFASNIEVVKAFVEQVPFSIKSTNGTAHPLLGISKIVLTGLQYNELADMVFGRRPKPVKALQQLMCYMAMHSRYDKRRKTHTLAFDKSNWNFTGYRLGKNGSSGGRPSVNYVYTLDDENTRAYLEEVYGSLPVHEQSKWTWDAQHVTVSRRVSQDSVSRKLSFDKTALP